ncbi:hypothetical protein BT69DRAFT_1316742 [Atractiella rhizophila]|nr:hypothetical protein BT69DRAFT_1316742 [Atractiella rhizophila]
MPDTRRASMGVVQWEMSAARMVYFNPSFKYALLTLISACCFPEYAYAYYRWSKLNEAPELVIQITPGSPCYYDSQGVGKCGTRPETETSTAPTTSLSSTSLTSDSLPAPSASSSGVPYPTTPSVSSATFIWISLDDPNINPIWLPPWNTSSSSPCNASDVSKSVIPSEFDQVISFMFDLQVGQGVQIGLRARIGAQYSASFFLSPAPPRPAFIGSSSGATPDDDNVCGNGTYIENVYDQKQTVLVSLDSFTSSFSARKTLLATRQAAPSWLRINGLWFYSLSPPSTASGPSGSSGINDSASVTLLVTPWIFVGSIIFWLFFEVSDQY